MRSVYYSRKWVIIAVIKLVSLGSHSGVSHNNIAVLVQSKVYLVSGVGTLVNRHLTVVVECVAGSVCASLLALF